VLGSVAPRKTTCGHFRGGPRPRIKPYKVVSQHNLTRDSRRCARLISGLSLFGVVVRLDLLLPLESSKFSHRVQKDLESELLNFGDFCPNAVASFPPPVWVKA
jgi:hypothetical protein